MRNELLTRDRFREGVFLRDGNLCVMCKAPGQDAHHIIERRLFPDGGYYLENGATVCGPCHILCEQTLITPEQLREKIGAKTAILPPHLYRDQIYDKWGNPILPNGMRVRGELFEDESIQKVLAPVLHLFTNRVKYPRTWHLPWSPGATSDDRLLTQEQVDTWNWEIVITEKRDGENSNLYRDGLHARSLDYEPHPSRSKLKALHSKIAYDIPENWRICCENLAAVHSIKYDNLNSICEVFSIWDGCKCMSWDETLLYAGILNLEVVPVLYRGPYNQQIIDKITKELDTKTTEGYVIRPADEFQLKDFQKVVGKYVRKAHVSTHGHWMRSKLEFNVVKE